MPTQVDKVPQVADSVAVGLRVGGDVEVVLFVKPAAAEGDSTLVLQQKVRAERLLNGKASTALRSFVLRVTMAGAASSIEQSSASHPRVRSPK